METRDIINKILNEKKMSKKYFAEKLIALNPKLKSTGEVPGIKTIYSYLNESIDKDKIREIKIELIPYIAEVLDISELDLFPNAQKQREKLVKKELKKNPTKYKTSSDDSVIVNIYHDQYASAGYGNQANGLPAQPTIFDKSFLMQFYNVKSFENLDMLRVTGNSMLPTIEDGEYIFIEKNTQIKNGDMIIARINNELFVKRFHQEPFNGDILLISDNDDFKPIVIDTEEKKDALIIIGIVRSKIKHTTY